MTDGSSKVRTRGRPPKRMPKLNASLERIGRAVFSSTKPPDSKRRVRKRKAASAS